jgi:hypothetical protein
MIGLMTVACATVAAPWPSDVQGQFRAQLVPHWDRLLARLPEADALAFVPVPSDVTLPYTGTAPSVSDATVRAGFSRGFSEETVYNHSTEIGLNGTLLGGGIVPQQSSLLFDVPPELLILQDTGNGTAQTINVRSYHTNTAHYTVATDFELSLTYGSFTTENCLAVSGVQGVSDGIGNLNLCPAFTTDICKTTTQTAGGYAPLYTLPDINSELVDSTSHENIQLPDGFEIIPLGRYDSWYRVRINFSDDSPEGWIESQYVNPNSTPDPECLTEVPFLDYYGTPQPSATPTPTFTPTVTPIAMGYVACDMTSNAKGRNIPSLDSTIVHEYPPGAILPIYEHCPQGGLFWERVNSNSEPTCQPGIWVARDDGAPGDLNQEILVIEDIHTWQTATPEASCTLMTLTPTPTSGPTFTPTMTPTPTETPIATITPVLSEPADDTPPEGLCSTIKGVSSPQWIQELCAQGWGYLDTTELSIVNTAIESNQLENINEFIDVDEWWLEHLWRGIGDVPPRVWDWQSHCVDVNGIEDEFCIAIAQTAQYYFNNMERIGADPTSAGSGQLGFEYCQFLKDERSDYSYRYQPLTDSDIFPRSDQNGPICDAGYMNSAFDYRQNFACGTNRFNTSRSGHDTQADVCWVCQDLPTQLYLSANGYDFTQEMLNSGMQAANIGNVTNPELNLSRYVPDVQSFLEGHGIYRNGTQLPYSVGDLVFLYEPGWDWTHVAVVIRTCKPDESGNQCSSFTDILEQTFVAQMSFSSQGFFSSNTEASDFANSGTIGRFEVITLETYLRKAAISQNYTNINLDGFDIGVFAAERISHGHPIR